MRVLNAVLTGALASLLCLPLAGHAEDAAKSAATVAAAAKPEVPEMLARPPGMKDAPTALEKQIDTVTDAAALARLAKGFEQKQDWRHQAYALEKLFVLRPMQGPIGYELAAAYARANNKRMSYDTLIRLQTSGYGFDPSKDERFKNVNGTPVWDYILLNLQANLKPFGGGQSGFTLPAGDSLIESLAYDPTAKTFLAASVRDGSILRVDAKGKSTPYIAADANNGLLAIYGLAVDAERDALWVIGNGVPHRKGLPAEDFGRALLYRFTLSSGEYETRFETPAAHRPALLSSIAVAANGTPYVADGLARRIYRLENGTLKAILENPRLTSIRGLSFSGDGNKLYFADYDLGLFGVDLNTGKAFVVQPHANLTLYGIESVHWWNGQLVVVQNGFPPARVMRLALDDTGTRVKQGQALDAAKPEFGLPTQGVIVGNDFWFIANSQRGQYDRYGVPRDASKIEAVRVYRSDIQFAIDSGKNIVTPLADPMPAGS